MNKLKALTKELKKLLDEPNLDPIDIMARTRRYFGADWIDSDIPTYYRNTLKKYKPNKNYEDFNN